VSGNYDKTAGRQQIQQRFTEEDGRIQINQQSLHDFPDKGGRVTDLGVENT
jgi:hypothetical protein